MKKLYKVQIERGYGNLTSLCILSKPEYNYIIGKTYYSCEELGKYSEFDFVVEEEYLEEITLPRIEIEKLYKKYGRVILGIDLYGTIKEQN